MIVVRDVFQVKFGKAREAVAAWKEGQDIFRKLDSGKRNLRLLTDLAGAKYYTLVLEVDYESLAEHEKAMANIMGNGDWQKWYQKFIPLADSGHREIMNVVQ